MKSLSKTAIISFGLISCSKFLGFIREIVLAYKYGTSYINDAYSICISLPTVLFAVFASGIAQSYIPTVSRINGKNERESFFNKVLTTLLMTSVVLCGICLFFDKSIVNLLAPGFNTQTAELTTRFVDIVVWFLPLYVIFNILSADSQAHESFVVPNFCDSIILNVVVIVFILLSTRESVELIVIGHVVAILIAVIVLYVYSNCVLGTKYRPCISIRDNNLALLFKLSIPLGISVMANQLNSVTDRIFSSYIGEGVTSALGYANRIQILFLTLTTTVFMSICFPRMNSFFSRGDKNQGLYYVENGMLLTSLISIPFMLIIMAYSNPIICLLFQRGGFNDQSTQITAECLTFYSIGIPFYAFAEIGNKTLAANLRQKYIMRNTLIMVGSNIILDFVLINLMQHKGLALATSVSGVISVLVMYNDLRKFDLLPKGRVFIKQTIHISVLSFASIIFSIFIYHLLMMKCSLPILASFLISVIVFGLAFCVFCFVCNVPIFKWLVRKTMEIGKGSLQ